MNQAGYATKPGEMLLNLTDEQQQDDDRFIEGGGNESPEEQVGECGLLEATTTSPQLIPPLGTSRIAYLPALEDKQDWVHRQTIPQWIAALSFLTSTPRNRHPGMIAPLP